MMKQTIARAWRLYRRHFGPLMLGLLLQLVLRLMVLTPLLFLAADQTRPLALLSLLLWMLIILPARQNAALAFADLSAGRPLNLLAFVSCRDYGRKLARGLKQTGLMLLWALPFLAATGLVLFVYFGKAIEGITDTFTILRTVISLGNSQAVQSLLPISESATIRGVVAMVALYLLTLLPLFFGMAFHSGTRHAHALGSRRMLRGHRGGMVLTWAVGLVTLLPFALVAFRVGAGYLSGVMAALGNLGAGSIALPPLDRNVWLIAAAFVVLCLPLVPLKQLLTACRVRLLASSAAEAAA